MKLTSNIDVRELVPKSMWLKHGARSIRFINAQLVFAMQWLIDRHELDAVYFNNWMYGGDKEQRGLRIPGQHYFRGDGLHDTGNAFDFIPVKKGYTLKEIIIKIHLDAAKNPELYWMAGIWRIENIELASTWIHIDAMFSPNQHEVVFVDLTKRLTAFEYLQQLKQQGYELPNDQ